MNAIAYLQNQLANIHSVFHYVVNDLTDEEWVTRPAPSHNMLGFTVWHIPRVQDSFVQTSIRGAPEVIHGDRWASWRHLRRHGNGIGISLAAADEIARSTQLADVTEYADAVQGEISTWLKELNESDLDALPKVSEHLSPYPEYQTPGFIEEVRGLSDHPIWSQLMRLCIGHVHRHLGELQVVKDILRSPH